MVERRDGASLASVETAIAKARMAALNGKPTAAMEASINGERPALLQLAGLLGQPAAAMAGGLPILLEGLCLGAVGVSGMTPDVDSAIAAAGLNALPR
jgi:glc operon protein GlcG